MTFAEFTRSPFHPFDVLSLHPFHPFAEFTLYDKGVNPEKLDKSQLDGSQIQVRQELGTILYKQNVLGSRGPRKMKVMVPSVNDSGQRKVLRPTSRDETMLECAGLTRTRAQPSRPHPTRRRTNVRSERCHGLRLSACAPRLGRRRYKAAKNDDDVQILKNKQPKWNDQVGAYVLNFNGRVTRASVKNFQLCNMARDPDTVLMQFGRVGKDSFNMDYQYPLCALQAFGIALSSFDYKIACEWCAHPRCRPAHPARPSLARAPSTPPVALAGVGGSYAFAASPSLTPSPSPSLPPR